MTEKTRSYAGVACTLIGLLVFGASVGAGIVLAVFDHDTTAGWCITAGVFVGVFVGGLGVDLLVGEDG